MLELTFTVNGKVQGIVADPAATLLEAIRESLLLTGAKEACGVGECGNCMVLLNGEPTPSCLVLAADAGGADIVTVEGLGADGELDPVQAAFVEEGAFQCGFCTPGMVVTAKALLRDHPDAEPDRITEALSGVLCRCGSYPKIMKALEKLTRERT
jgi:aerobic-type carbon monoxide dehydrogenase small subunit (CoxS/CutS family)